MHPEGQQPINPKPKKERYTITGMIEKWADRAKAFGIGGRGSIGFAVNGQWHNLVGLITDLINTKTQFPEGSIVRFTEEKNLKGYFDVVGTLGSADAPPSNNKYQQQSQVKQAPVVEETDFTNANEIKQEISYDPQMMKQKHPEDVKGMTMLACLDKATQICIAGWKDKTPKDRAAQITKLTEELFNGIITTQNKMIEDGLW